MDPIRPYPLPVEVTAGISRVLLTNLDQLSLTLFDSVQFNSVQFGSVHYKDRTQVLVVVSEVSVV